MRTIRCVCLCVSWHQDAVFTSAVAAELPSAAVGLPVPYAITRDSVRRLVHTFEQVIRQTYSSVDELSAVLEMTSGCLRRGGCVARCRC
jgi:hypothetical protein